MRKNGTRKRLLFLAPSMGGGGAERFLSILMRHMDRNRFQLTMGLVKKTGPFLEDLPRDIDVVDLKAGRVRYALSRIIRMVRKNRPDAVFSTLGHLNVATILIRPLMPRGTKIIIRETNIPSINIKQSPFTNLLPFFYRMLYNRFDKVICQSQDMLNDLVTNFGFRRDNGIVINNPVDLESIDKKIHGSKNLLPPGVFNILAAGKLKYQKGFDLLLKSMDRVQRVDWHLTILGQGPEEQRLKKKAHELCLSKMVTFRGFVENPYTFMSQADLFVLSSRFEGFPNVVLEAMACGTPVVAFECPGGINEIIDDGVNGWKVRPEDTRALTRAIETAMETLLDSNLIRKYVQERFGVEKIVNEYETMFLEVLNS